jgi:hypothetical protein
MTQVDITAHEVNDGVLRLPLVLSVTPREDVAVGRVDQMATENTSHLIEHLGRRHIRPPPPAAPRLARSWTRPTH